MKTVMLGTILKKLVRQNLINSKSILKINYDTLPYKKSIKIDYEKLTESMLLSPVLEVYIGWGDIMGIKRYAELDKTPIEFRFTRNEIVNRVKNEEYNSSEYLNDGYFFYIVLKKLPDEYLKSYIYKENFISYSLFLTLLEHKNTIMSEDIYNKALDYSIRNKRLICKRYNIKPDDDGKPKSAHTVLEMSISKICGFDIRIRGTDYGINKIIRTYIIEKIDAKK